MPHVDFDEEQAQSTVQPSDTTFVLGGRTWTCRDRLDISTAVIAAHIAATDELYANPDDPGAVRKAALASTGFLRGVVMPEEADAFMELLTSPELSITGRTTTKVFRLLIEHATARPTKPAARSSTGRKRTGRKSTAGSSSPDTAPAASAG